MKSKASFKSHPIHPILVAFPIAFLTGAFFFDILSLFFDEYAFDYIGHILVLAGLIAGVVAAIPGIIDYKYTIPGKSSAKKRATHHALLNSTALILFLIVVNIRHEPVTISILVLEFAGVVCLSIAGWKGGTLVHRNQIGIDIRYANAGKWKEEHLGTQTGNIFVANIDELQIDQMKLLHVNNLRIVLARQKEGYVAFDDRCSHRGASLAAGTMICGTVQCPWHGSQFNVSNGKVLAGPAKEPIKTYQISEGDGKVYLRLTEN